MFFNPYLNILQDKMSNRHVDRYSEYSDETNFNLQNKENVQLNLFINELIAFIIKSMMKVLNSIESSKSLFNK